MIARNEN